MSLTLDWGNVGAVALPVLTSLCIGAILTTLLWRASWRSALPHRRESCIGCIHEDRLSRRLTCEEDCSVNTLPGVPLGIFLATSSLAVFSLFYPSLVVQFVLPAPGQAPAGLTNVLLWTVVASTVTSSLVLTAYFVQDTALHREILTRVSVVGALTGILAGSDPAFGFQGEAQVLTPVALLALVFGLALEERSRLQRPVFGLRALALSLLPLFLLTVIALARILLILAQAGI